MTEIATQEPMFTTAQLQGIDGFADAAQALREQFGDDIVSSFDAKDDDGFAVCSDKSVLVGKPFILLQWTFREGDHGAYVSINIVTEDGAKLILNDGSKGIFAQLSNLSAETGRVGGGLAPAGLKRSDYTYTDADGNSKNATTFYLS